MADTAGSDRPRAEGADTTTEPGIRPTRLPGVVIYFLRLVRDFITFFIRGGLSTMMFSMDMGLGFLVYIFETILVFPGSQVLVYAARFIMWLYQVFLWVLYTMFELLIYLPTPFLFLYVIILGLVYAFMPDYVDKLISTAFWMAENFLDLLQYLLLDSSEDNDSKK